MTQSESVSNGSMGSERPEIVSLIAEAWGREGIGHAMREAGTSGRHVEVSLPRRQSKRAVWLACAILQSAEWKTCVDRSVMCRSILAFKAENGKFTALRIDVVPRESGPILVALVSFWHRIFVRRAPSLAVVGPDGVGKSTTLTLVREWFEQQAPFISVCFRQWRPSLLPQLGSYIGKPAAPEAHKPRRTPGRLHLVRLVYYYLDYVIGSWWKDRRNLSGSTLIVYDRCALDMEVDPYRFALSSTWGTKLLWRMTPKPRMIILLCDEPQRIYQRKRDLEPHEMHEQFMSWFRLVQEGKVHAIVRVDARPEEISSRILNLFIDAFVQCNEPGPGDDFQGQRQLQWISSILAGASPACGERLEENQTPSPSADTGAEFLVVPSKSDPRFLIPVDAAPAMSSALPVYNAHNPFAPPSRSFRFRIAPRFSRDRISLCREALIGEHLSSVFNRETLSASISLGSPGPNQKPVLQVMNSRGGIQGCAKVGWSQPTIDLIRNEEITLRTLAEETFSEAGVPRVLHAGFWRDMYVLVQDVPAWPAGRSPAQIEEPHVRFLIELLRVRPVRQPLSLPDAQLVQKLKKSGLHYYAHLLTRAREFCGERLDHAAVPGGLLHGDFAPWNMRFSGSRLMVFDWERARPAAPAGWDLFHFLICAAVVRGDSAGKIYRTQFSPGSENSMLNKYFGAVGVSPELVQLLLTSYLADVLAQNLLLHGERATGKDRELRGIWTALLNLMFWRGVAQGPV